MTRREVRLVLIFDVPTDDSNVAATEAARAVVSGAVSLRDAQCRVFTVSDDGRKFGPILRTEVYRETLKALGAR